MPRSIVQCRVLGAAEIYTDATRLTPESELQFGLTLYLCANAGRGLLRDEMAHVFWPGQPSEPARHCLRQALYRLRGLGVPVSSGARVTMLEERYVEADYLPLVAEGAPASVYVRVRDVSVLPGYIPRFSRPFAEWLEAFRNEVASRVRRGLVRAIADARARGRYSLVEELARRCLAIDPLNEEATLALAEHRTGTCSGNPRWHERASPVVLPPPSPPRLAEHPTTEVSCSNPRRDVGPATKGPDRASGKSGPMGCPVTDGAAADAVARSRDNGARPCPDRLSAFHHSIVPSFQFVTHRYPPGATDERVGRGTGSAA